MIKGNLFITGGAGTLGKAIIRRALDEKWDCGITVFSRDPVKHIELNKLYPSVRCIQGNVADYDTLYRSMVGHSHVIHAAAMKHVPQGEVHSLETVQDNVSGSANVAQAATYAGVKRVVGISTDKACHAVNAYGATKYLMEKIFQEYARSFSTTKFNLVRYGNVLGSTGSVINVWREHVEEYGKVYATDEQMSRFWLTVDDAVDLIVHSLTEPSGTISIPRCPSLSMGKLAEYVLPEGTEIEYTGMRPGEKRHEMLVTEQEALYVEPGFGTIPLCPVMRLWPTTSDTYDDTLESYTSDNADRDIERDELLRMIGE